MSQDSGSLSRVRTVLSKHKAFEQYRRKESTPKNSSPYINFLKEKRSEILSQDPAVPKKQVMKAIVAAWNNLSPLEKKGYNKGTETPEEIQKPPKQQVVGRKREMEDQPAQEPRKRPKMRRDTDAYAEAPYNYRSWESDYEQPNLFLALGSALKSVASYFLVRPL